MMNRTATNQSGRKRCFGLALAFTFAICQLMNIGAGYAQETLISKDPHAYQRFLTARQWFAEENFKLAYPIFQELYLTTQKPAAADKQLFAEEVEFYKLSCELMEDNPGAEAAAVAFMASNAASNLKGQLGYYLGSYFFRKNDYPSAIAAFEKASIGNLSNQQVATLHFQHGYSLITQKQFAAAKPLLNSVRQSPESPYYVDANYYYGLLAFNENNFKEALQCFEVAKTSPKYQAMMPYYLAGINYTMGQKDKAMQQAETALRAGNAYHKAELQQLVGHGYFEKKAYSNARKYLEQYVASAPKVKREDLYELAYCYYIEKQYPKAITQFKPLAGGEDSLSQHAMYLLGDSYLKTGQKANARNAFLFCSTNSSNPLFKEISLFNYGKLSFELSFDNEALLALKQYVAQYPSGKYNAEAKDLLVGVLSKTSNYKEGLELYESLSVKSELAQREYPKIAFNRAQELLNDRKPAEAELLLDNALAAKYNEPVQALANFWKGEIAFSKSNYNGAVQRFGSYLQQPLSSGEATPLNAKYNLGYALMRQEQYKQAAGYFDEIKNASFANQQQRLDVLIRLADCYYMQKEFSKAGSLYAQVSGNHGFGSDYALLQQGMISGAQNRQQEKVTTLRSIESQYPASSLVGVANMEIADTYLADEKFRDAVPYLVKITGGNKDEGLKPEAYLKLGLAHYNLDNNQEALLAFKTLLRQYPNAQESEEALDNVRSIYVEEGQPEGYVSFLKDAGRKVEHSVADSLTFTAAELQLSEGKKPQALAGFKKYLQQYPNGRYALEANYFAGEISRENKNLREAATYYEVVASQAPNKYAERSLLFLARMYYFDFKEYEKAAGFYSQLKQFASAPDNKLEAMRGLVRSQCYANKFAEAVDNAKELLQQGNAGSDDKVFANMVLAKNARLNGDCAAAMLYFKPVVTMSKAEFGAEARYQIAQCLYEQAKLAEAEKAAFEVIQKSGSYELWVVKSYILLGDIYFTQKDYFNAKATYKSVSENATIPELKKEALDKLAKAEAASATESKIGGQ